MAVDAGPTFRQYVIMTPMGAVLINETPAVVNGKTTARQASYSGVFVNEGAPIVAATPAPRRRRPFLIAS